MAVCLTCGTRVLGSIDPETCSVCDGIVREMLRDAAELGEQLEADEIDDLERELARAGREP